MKQNEIYMLITTDRYELPVAVADTVKELAFLIGVTENNIRSAMSKAKKRETRCRYVKVVIEEEEK